MLHILFFLFITQKGCIIPCFWLLHKPRSFSLRCTTLYQFSHYWNNKLLSDMIYIEKINLWLSFVVVITNKIHGLMQSCQMDLFLIKNARKKKKQNTLKTSLECFLWKSKFSKFLKKTICGLANSYLSFLRKHKVNLIKSLWK